MAKRTQIVPKWRSRALGLPTFFRSFDRVDDFTYQKIGSLSVMLILRFFGLDTLGVSQAIGQTIGHVSTGQIL